MENKKEEQGLNIDEETLDVMKQEDILEAISSEKEIKRMELNCFAELYGAIKDLRADIDTLNQMISVVSADKLTSFFKEVQSNLDVETKRVNVQNKIKEGHKKSKKVNKTGEKSVK